jgi:hypothetical protein
VLCQTKKKREKKSLRVFLSSFRLFFFFANLGVRGPSFPHSASSFLFCVTKRRSAESLIFRVYKSFAFTCLWSIIVSVFVFLGWFLFIFPPF